MKKRKIRIFSINIRVRKKILVFFLVLFVIGFVFVLFMNYLVNPILVKTGESQISQHSTKAMNTAVSEVLQDSINYDDLIHLVTDSSGKISLIQANSVQINILSRRIIENTYKSLVVELKSPLKIPIGSFTGIPIFSNLGPQLIFDLIPYNDVTCSFVSEFVSAGINQTHHKIYASIDTVVNVVLPMNKLRVKTNSDFLVCESVIIGDIPATYLNSNSLDEMMNLIPLD